MSFIGFVKLGYLYPRKDTDSFLHFTAVLHRADRRTDAASNSLHAQIFRRTTAWKQHVATSYKQSPATMPSFHDTANVLTIKWYYQKQQDWFSDSVRKCVFQHSSHSMLFKISSQQQVRCCVLSIVALRLDVATQYCILIPNLHSLL